MNVFLTMVDSWGVLKDVILLPSMCPSVVTRKAGSTNGCAFITSPCYRSKCAPCSLFSSRDLAWCAGFFRKHSTKWVDCSFDPSWLRSVWSRKMEMEIISQIGRKNGISHAIFTGRKQLKWFYFLFGSFKHEQTI